MTTPTQQGGGEAVAAEAALADGASARDPGD